MAPELRSLIPVHISNHCDYCGAELEVEDCPNYGNGPEHAGISTAQKIED